MTVAGLSGCDMTGAPGTAVGRPSLLVKDGQFDCQFSELRTRHLHGDPRETGRPPYRRSARRGLRMLPALRRGQGLTAVRRYATRRAL